MKRSLLLALTAILLVLLPSQVAALQCPGQGGPPPQSPLVLDLNGNGIYTTSVFHPVDFDLDGDGVAEPVTWINSETGDAFLVLDLNGNGVIDNGRELFGTSTLLPDGTTAANGFEALAVYDDPAFGGDGDGMITPRDHIWSRLRLWSDTSYDGISEPWELTPLGAEKVWAIGLEFLELNYRDGSLNLHWLQGAYVKRIAGPDHFRTYAMEDIVLYSDPDP